MPTIFAQIVILASSLGLADFSDISIDGTKIKANASKKNLFNKDEIKKITNKMKEVISEAEAIDTEEDKRFAESRGYNQVPEHLADPKIRKAKIAKLQKKLIDLAQANQARLAYSIVSNDIINKTLLAHFSIAACIQLNPC